MINVASSAGGRGDDAGPDRRAPCTHNAAGLQRRQRPGRRLDARDSCVATCLDPRDVWRSVVGRVSFGLRSQAKWSREFLFSEVVSMGAKVRGPSTWAASLLPGFVCLLVAIAPGCLFLPGPEKLARIRAERPEEPWAEAVFRQEPGEGERSFGELRETLRFWLEPGPEGKPRAAEVFAMEPPDLYARVLEAIDAGEPEVKLVAYLYDANGLDRYTLVDWFGAGGRRFGTDWVLYDEPLPPATGPATVGWDDLAWWEWPQLILDVPVYTVIGLKGSSSEVAKSPLSALDAGWLGTGVALRSPVSPVSFERAGRAVWEDWKDGFSAFTWRFRARSRHTPLDLVLDFGREIPVVGLLFERAWPPDVEGVPPGIQRRATSSSARGSTRAETRNRRRARGRGGSR